MIVVTLARKPLAEANVAANTLRHGCGAVNIGAARIATSDDLNGGAYSSDATERHDGAENWRYKRGEQGGLSGAAFVQPPGRWPANLILQHLDGCVLEGVHRVRSNGHFPAARPSGSQVSGPSGHAGQSGLEERHTDGEAAERWACAPGCPVASLDAQAGHLVSGKPTGVQGGRTAGETGEVFTTFNQKKTGTPMSGYGDAGGASRFFKTLGGARG